MFAKADAKGGLLVSYFLARGKSIYFVALVNWELHKLGVFPYWKEFHFAK